MAPDLFCGERDAVQLPQPGLQAQHVEVLVESCTKRNATTDSRKVWYLWMHLLISAFPHSFFPCSSYHSVIPPLPVLSLTHWLVVVHGVK